MPASPPATPGAHPRVPGLQPYLRPHQQEALVLPAAMTTNTASAVPIAAKAAAALPAAQQEAIALPATAALARPATTRRIIGREAAGEGPPAWLVPSKEESVMSGGAASVYAATKRATEQLVDTYAHLYGLRAIGKRHWGGHTTVQQALGRISDIPAYTKHQLAVLVRSSPGRSRALSPSTHKAAAHAASSQ
jgi:hypothetical protein